MKKLLLLVGLLASTVYADYLETRVNYSGPSTSKPGYYSGRSRGTARDPESIKSSDTLVGIYSNGYKPNGFTTNTPVNIQFQADENWTNSATGSKIILQVTSNTTTTPFTAMTVNGASTTFANSVLISTLTINNGAAITKHLSSTASLDFGPTAAGTCDALTITVTGAVDGNTVELGIPTALAGSDSYQIFWGYVSAANTVTVKRCNPINSVTALSDPAAATVRADVWIH